ncbi:MAG TPA: alpha/beta fold hydrolase [Pyrinomonadaceae bacterium]|nr:alpha/beta fold hydrolase [Pyrinomonadaceae bacterium]
MLTRRCFRLSIALILLIIPAALAQEATSRAPVGRVIEARIDAPSLKGNLLGDPSNQKFSVYLPPSYDIATAKRYPTLYLLHGFLRDNTDWTTTGLYQGLKLQTLMDDMIKSGKIHELIVVAPNAYNAYGGSFYTNSPVTGNWEDYISRDLVQYVDSNYRTMARAESRGIAGHSMGGYGAIWLAMKHPDVFSVVYGLSPCCLGFEGDFSDKTGWPSTLRLTSKDQLKIPPLSVESFYQDAFVALAASFSPNPQRPPFFADFPYQEREGHLVENPEVFARWRSHMPLYTIDENKANLMKLRGIFFDYGTKEEFSHVKIASQLFSKGLAERNIPHGLEVYDGTHVSKIRERVESRLMPFFSEKLDFSGAK